MELQGKLLVASPEMGDPNFEQAVILMIQHSAEGGLGLILNRPTDVSVRDAMAASGESSGGECQTEEMLFRGGPCEGPLMVLHRDADFAQQEVMEGVFFATERPLIEPALRGSVRPARFYAGYAGWGPGQVEIELRAGAWRVAAAQPRHVFESSSDHWAELSQPTPSILKQLNPKIVPDDPSRN